MATMTSSQFWDHMKERPRCTGSRGFPREPPFCYNTTVNLEDLPWRQENLPL